MTGRRRGPPLAETRLFDVREAAASVARDLAERPAPFVSFLREWGAGPRWYTFELDDDLLERLLRDDRSVLEALDLHEHQSREAVVLHGPVPGGSRDAGGLLTVLDPAGAVRGVLGRGLPAQEATLFARVDHSRPHVGEGDVVDIGVTLSGDTLEGLVSELSVTFPEGLETLAIHAAAESPDFMPEGQAPWSATFVVARDLSVTPSSWAFSARAVGARPRYQLRIVFKAAGAVISTLRLTLHAPASLLPPEQSGGECKLPKERGADLVIALAERPGNLCEVSLIDGDRRWHDAPLPWQLPGADDLFGRLSSLEDDTDVRELGFEMRAELPAEVADFLERPGAEGRSVLIQSDGRVAPFEVMQLHPDADGPLLGVERAVTRWISRREMPERTRFAAGKPVCIRPTYPAPDDLPDAAQEEAIVAAFGEGGCRVARTLADLGAVLDDGGVGLVHFAGHASGSPAGLTLEDGRVRPAKLHPGRPLMREGHPLFFLNGCYAGKAAAGQPAAVSNFALMLLQAGACGVVAPTIEVKTGAAVTAARVFYAALEQGSTVAEAVRAIHRRALDPATPLSHRASLLSYLAFGHHALRPASAQAATT